MRCHYFAIEDEVLAPALAEMNITTQEASYGKDQSVSEFKELSMV
jgi:hypothetical protein